MIGCGGIELLILFGLVGLVAIQFCWQFGSTGMPQHAKWIVLSSG